MKTAVEHHYEVLQKLSGAVAVVTNTTSIKHLKETAKRLQDYLIPLLRCM